MIMIKIDEMISELKEKVKTCDYFIDHCIKDLKECNFSNLHSYQGCKIVLKDNMNDKDKYNNQLEILYQLKDDIMKLYQK